MEALNGANPPVESHSEESNARNKDSSDISPVTSNIPDTSKSSTASHQGQALKDGQEQGWNDPILLRREPEIKKPTFIKDERRAQPIFRIKQLSSEQSSSPEWSNPHNSYALQAPDNESINEICRRMRPLELEDSAVETEKLREQSRSWAVREKLTPSQIIELEMLMNLITSTFIPRSSIEGLRQIDKGVQCPFLNFKPLHPSDFRRNLRTRRRFLRQHLLHAL